MMSPPQTHHWEYQTLRPSREVTHKEAADLEDDLNELGADGWEFITTIEYEGGGTKYLLFIIQAACRGERAE